jgi:hypothetical protein
VCARARLTLVGERFSASTLDALEELIALTLLDDQWASVEIAVWDYTRTNDIDAEIYLRAAEGDGYIESGYLFFVSCNYDTGTATAEIVETSTFSVLYSDTISISAGDVYLAAC